MAQQPCRAAPGGSEGPGVHPFLAFLPRERVPARPKTACDGLSAIRQVSFEGGENLRHWARFAHLGKVSQHPSRDDFPTSELNKNRGAPGKSPSCCCGNSVANI